MSKTQKINLIEELTTHKCDFQKWPLSPVEARFDVRAREEPAIKPPPPHVLIDPQSHTPYKSSVHVPFDLYLTPKPIVGTDPRECFKTEKPCHARSLHENSEVSTILSPALHMSQIESEEDYQKIIKYSYTGLHKILMEESALRTSKPLDPPYRVVNEGNDLRFKPNLYPKLPPGWLAVAKHWDCLQSRNLGDPFKTFWTRRGPEVECGCCCNPLPDMLSKETKDQISTLICENKLRLPYDITKTGYGGYRQICAKGVPLDKSEVQNQDSVPKHKFLR